MTAGRHHDRDRVGRCPGKCPRCTNARVASVLRPLGQPVLSTRLEPVVGAVGGGCHRRLRVQSDRVLERFGVDAEPKSRMGCLRSLTDHCVGWAITGTDRSTTLQGWVNGSLHET